MKKFLIALITSVSMGFVNAQEAPAKMKTDFDETSLSQPIYDLEGNKLMVGDVLKKYEGKVILLDIWASWCPDCIKSMPKLKEVQKQHPEITYLFFSLDRVGKEDAWKNGILKYDIQGEHYWFNSDWKNDFTNYIDLNWIPRYLLINQTGKIVHYYAIHPDDPVMLEQLVELTLQPKN